MDEIEKRLRETSEACVNFYQEWRANEHNGDTRERLQESIHELRKVVSRLEIEMAVSEREEMAQKPIPIPPHRAKRERGNNNKSQSGESFPDETMPEKGQRPGSVRRSRRRQPPAEE
jgi:hypothetical protein